MSSTSHAECNLCHEHCQLQVCCLQPNKCNSNNNTLWVWETQQTTSKSMNYRKRRHFVNCWLMWQLCCVFIQTLDTTNRSTICVWQQSCRVQRASESDLVLFQCCRRKEWTMPHLFLRLFFPSRLGRGKISRNASHIIGYSLWGTFQRHLTFEDFDWTWTIWVKFWLQYWSLCTV